MENLTIKGKVETSATQRCLLVKDYLNNVLKDILSVLRAESGSVFLFDSEKKELTLDACYNKLHLHLKGIKQRVGEGITGKVVDLNKPVLVKDIREDARFCHNGFNHYHTNSFISIPLFASQSIIGVINITDKKSGESFSEKDFEFAVTISRYACSAVEKILCPGHDHLQSNITVPGNESEHNFNVRKLAAGIVHEINNPLDGIIRYSDILLRDLEDSPGQREYLLEIKKGLDRIAGITRSLTQFSGRKQEPPHYVEVKRLLEESLSMFAQHIGPEIVIKKIYRREDLVVQDMGLGQVFTNLIKNALDAMPNGGVLEMLVDATIEGLEITFTDSGEGIDETTRQRMFDPFFTTKPVHLGTGIGLSICKDIVHRYSGKIEVNSIRGKGSAFSVIIPGVYLKREHN